MYKKKACVTVRYWKYDEKSGVRWFFLIWKGYNKWKVECPFIGQGTMGFNFIDRIQFCVYVCPFADGQAIWRRTDDGRWPLGE